MAVATEGFLQDRYIPEYRCFGCGPANTEGLQVKTVWVDGEVVGEWMPKAHHESIRGILSSGIIASLLDCSCSWACVMEVMQQDHSETPPAMLTKEFTVRLLKPAYLTQMCSIRSRVVSRTGRRVEASAELLQNGEVCATCSLVSVIIDQSL